MFVLNVSVSTLIPILSLSNTHPPPSQRDLHSKRKRRKYRDIKTVLKERLRRPQMFCSINRDRKPCNKNSQAVERHVRNIVWQVIDTASPPSQSSLIKLAFLKSRKILCFCCFNDLKVLVRLVGRRGCEEAIVSSSHPSTPTCLVCLGRCLLSKATVGVLVRRKKYI